MVFPRSKSNRLKTSSAAYRSIAKMRCSASRFRRPAPGNLVNRSALSDLLTRFPGAALLNLDAEQRIFAIERYAALDVFKRFDLDLGKTILERAPSATTALARLKQVRDYVKETIAASFRRLRDAGRPLTAGRVSQFAVSYT